MQLKNNSNFRESLLKKKKKNHSKIEKNNCKILLHLFIRLFLKNLKIFIEEIYFISLKMYIGQEKLPQLYKYTHHYLQKIIYVLTDYVLKILTALHFIFIKLKQ